MKVDENLRQFATDRQWEMYCSYCETNSDTETAKVFGVERSTVNSTRHDLMKKAAKRGYSPVHGFTQIVPEGFNVRGVSTLYSADGEIKSQWVKSNANAEQQQQMFDSVIRGVIEKLPKEPVMKRNSAIVLNDDLLVTYPVGDHHIGMLVWPDETNGGIYDTDIAEKLLINSFEYLSEAAPASREALLVFLGDLLHYDSLESVTPTARNQLDSDTRYANVVRVAIRSIRYMVTQLLRKHETVTLIIEIGNHDISSSIFLMETFKHIFADNPRVVVDNSPAMYHYYKFGKNLIGTHHGHEVKSWNQLPLIMATDRSKDWGDTTHRIWFTGHIHNQKKQDFPGCSVESFRILAPGDAWSHGKGYRAIQDMKCITFHREYGEVARNTVNPQMVS